jgi:hypothetical protein
MKARHIVNLRSEDAQFFFKIFLGKRSLFTSAIRKIATFYNLAKERHVYAYIFLFKIRAEIISVLDNIEHDAKKFKKTIRKRHSSVEKVKYQVARIVPLTFGNPMAYKLIEVLEKFDMLICWLVLAKNMEIFTKRKTFFRVREKHQKRFFNMLTNIVHLPSLNLPMVTIEDYLKANEIYQKAVKELGEIDPQKLYDAIQLAATPALTAKEVNQISYQLESTSKEKSS